MHTAFQYLNIVLTALALLASGPNTRAQVIHTTPGIFALGGGGHPMPSVIYDQPFVSGGAVRTSWAQLEPEEGVFDWSFIDGELATAEQAGKKISIYLGAGSVGTPAWVRDSLPIASFRFIDMNPYHPTYLDTLDLPVPWATLYLEKLTGLIQAFGAHYANDTTIAYLRGASCMVTDGWGLANTDVLGNTWAAYGYTPDTLVHAFEHVLTAYMAAFPGTPEWVEVGNINFEPFLSGHSKTYVAERMTAFGVANYPGRFGAWTENFNACFPDPPPASSYWHLLHDLPCHSGSQAVWSVQDGMDCQFRMLSCDTSGTVCDKDTVLWHAVQRCLDYGMAYLEIYQGDIMDPGLGQVLQQTAAGLVANWEACNLVTDVPAGEVAPPVLSISPLPLSAQATVRMQDPAREATVYVYDALGKVVREMRPPPGRSFTLMRNDLLQGSYVLRLTEGDKTIGTARLMVAD